MQPTPSCPVCGNPLLKHLEVADHSVSKKMFTLFRCGDCELLMTSPQPGAREMNQYYQSENYVSHTGKGNNLVNRLYILARTFTLRKKISLLNQFTEKASLLDYGCGTGHFLAEAKASGWRTFGVEPSPSARNQISHSPVVEDLDQLPDIKFSAITLWHVLEHVPDLHAKIEKLKSILEQNGKIFVAVPNHNSYDSKFYGTNWAAYDVPRHLWHFSRKTISVLAKKHDLMVEKILPMPLDAYYISILSEQYRTRKPHPLLMLKAFFPAFRSNLRARNTGEYSSLLYILTR